MALSWFEWLRNLINLLCDLVRVKSSERDRFTITREKIEAVSIEGWRSIPIPDT